MESNIRNLRNMKHISQKELAKIVGMTQQAVSYMENDRDRISIESLITMADYFGVTTDCVLGIEEGKITEKEDDAVSDDGKTLKEEIDNLCEILTGNDNKVLYELLLSTLLCLLKEQPESK